MTHLNRREVVMENTGHNYLFKTVLRRNAVKYSKVRKSELATVCSSRCRNKVGMPQFGIHAAQITRTLLEVLILNTTDKLRFQRDLFRLIVIDVQKPK